MNGIYLVAGVLLLTTVSVDILWTTLWVQGSAGPLTSRLMSAEWSVLRRMVGNRRRLLSLSGPIILVTSLAVWIALLWGGWTVLFAAGEPSLMDTRENGPISWAERLYYIGYTIFTMGNGDFTPQDGVWQTATAVAAGSGMLFVTLSVTYILSVLDAVTQKRSFASGVTGLGVRSEAIVESGWDGETLQSLDLPLNTYVTQLNTLISNHKAYPILHYFYSPDDQQAAPVSIALLDDVLTTLQFGVPEEDRPNIAIIKTGRSSLANYLDVLESTTRTADRVPPPPDIAALRESGIPTVSPDEFENALEEMEQHRRKLLGIVESDERHWPGSEDE